MTLEEEFDQKFPHSLLMPRSSIQEMRADPNLALVGMDVKAFLRQKVDEAREGQKIGELYGSDVVVHTKDPNIKRLVQEFITHLLNHYGVPTFESGHHKFVSEIEKARQEARTQRDKEILEFIESMRQPFRVSENMELRDSYNQALDEIKNYINERSN